VEFQFDGSRLTLHGVCNFAQTYRPNECHHCLSIHKLKKVLMSHVPVVSQSPVIQARAMPSMTWNGTLAEAAGSETHFLHLSAFPCEKCNGPVIAGSLGTRLDDISQETDIRSVGAVCIACGLRPETMVEPVVNHRFRPVEWKWAIKEHAQPDGLSTELSEELAQDADGKP
jgi:hypothetical protein